MYTAVAPDAGTGKRAHSTAPDYVVRKSHQPKARTRRSASRPRAEPSNVPQVRTPDLREVKRQRGNADTSKVALRASDEHVDVDNSCFAGLMC
jgi:hypothetical protein